MLSRVSLFIIAWAVLLFPVLTCAGDSLDAILLRMKVKEVKHFNYTEIRHMQLLTRPWWAEGEMFVSPEQMVISQHSPEQRFISIRGDRILYIDPDRQIRRQHRLKNQFSVPGMEPLMQIFYSSDEPADLEKKFITGFKLNNNRWYMTLQPKKINLAEVSKMTISGEEGAEPDHLELQFKDGDRTEWTLSLGAKGDTANEKMDRILEQMNSSVDPWPGLSGS